MPEPAVAEQDLWNDLRPLLDQELRRLPDIYRVVLVLCDLEGQTRKEAARQLGLPEGTVGSRLARARVLLAKRLTQRGVVLSGAVLGEVLLQKVASAGVPDSVVSSTIRAAGFLAAGQGAAAGLVSVEVAALTEGVLKAMLRSKLKTVVAVVLALSFLGTGATVFYSRTAPAQAGQPPAGEKRVQEPQQPDPTKGAFTAWGKEVGGVQAGIGYLSGPKRAYHVGEVVKLAVRVRNVGKQEVKFSYYHEDFYEHPPIVTDGAGKTIPLEGVFLSGLPRRVDVSLAAGKEIKLCELYLTLRPASARAKERPIWKLFGAGNYQLQYKQMGGNLGIGEPRLDPILGKLVTGKLELEVKSAPPPATRED
jgi:hypothetical protein